MSQVDRSSWDEQTTERVVEAVVIGAAIAILTELGKLGIELLRKRAEAKGAKP